VRQPCLITCDQRILDRAQIVRQPCLIMCDQRIVDRARMLDVVFEHCQSIFGSASDGRPPLLGAQSRTTPIRCRHHKARASLQRREHRRNRLV
jgi:hypothetical protein